MTTEEKIDELTQLTLFSKVPLDHLPGQTFRNGVQSVQLCISAAISASAWRAISVRDIGRDSERICGIYVVKLCEVSVRYIIVILCKLQGTG